MSVKDYFKFFTSLNDGDEIDYIVSFKVPKPNISEYPNLMKIGTWRIYSDNGYRLDCTLSKDDFLELISHETNISKENIEIIIPAAFIYPR